MFDFLIGLAFVVMVIGPAILASVQRSKSHDDGASDTDAADGSEVAALTDKASDTATGAGSPRDSKHGGQELP